MDLEMLKMSKRCVGALDIFMRELWLIEENLGHKHTVFIIPETPDEEIIAIRNKNQVSILQNPMKAIDEALKDRVFVEQPLIGKFDTMLTKSLNLLLDRGLSSYDRDTGRRYVIVIIPDASNAKILVIHTSSRLPTDAEPLEACEITLITREKKW